MTCDMLHTIRNYFRSNNDICDADEADDKTDVKADADADADAGVIEGKFDKREALPFCFCCI